MVIDSLLYSVYIQEFNKPWHSEKFQKAEQSNFVSMAIFG